MSQPSSKKIDFILKSEHKNLGFLLAKVRELEALNKRFISYLEPALRDYCRVANQVGPQLVLMVANGSIATHIKLQSLDLIQKFKQDSLLRSIKTIHCKVHPSIQPTRQRTISSNIALLSPETAHMIQEIANSLQDAKLKEIMQRIASHTNRTIDNGQHLK